MKRLHVGTNNHIRTSDENAYLLEATSPAADRVPPPERDEVLVPYKEPKRFEKWEEQIYT